MNYKLASCLQKVGSWLCIWQLPAFSNLFYFPVSPHRDCLPFWTPGPSPKCLTLLWEAVGLANADYVEITPDTGSFLHLPVSSAQHSEESDAPILHPGKLLQNWHLSLTAVHEPGCWSMAPRVP